MCVFLLLEKCCWKQPCHGISCLSELHGLPSWQWSHHVSSHNEIFAFHRMENAVYFCSSAERLESVVNSRQEFVYDKPG